MWAVCVWGEIEAGGEGLCSGGGGAMCSGEVIFVDSWESGVTLNM